MSTARENNGEQASNASSIQAAVARAATRAIALYFSRPIRLFRPSKVNGWQTLRALADRHGDSLTPRYITSLVQQQGPSVLTKHFVPPMLVNLVLGSVLWSTYAETSALVEQVCDLPLAVAAISGAVAGGAQALVAAPAENVRFLLEGGSQASGWSHAWQEVFRGTDRNSSLSSTARLQQARKVREWMREVGDMAGRGWDGWKWGMAKDSCGFAVFFAIFEVTRRLAADAKVASYTHIKRRDGEDCAQSHIPRIANAVTLVTGGAVAGLAYEFVCRPWDAARKAVHVDHIIAAHEHHTVSSILLHKVKEEGWSSFFQAPRVHVHETFTSPWHRRLHSALRTVARVGPWGVGFLVWEAFGPGLS